MYALKMIALGLALFANLILFVANENRIVEVLAGLPGPIATLIAGIVGLGTVAWQTRRGFANLIGSQEHRAKIERDARSHQAELALQQKLEERRHQRDLLAAAIHAELSTAVDHIGRAVQLLEVQGAIWKHSAKTEPNRTGEIIILAFEARVFMAHIKEIGLLGVSLGSDVIDIYGRVMPGIEQKNVSYSILSQIVDKLIAGQLHSSGEVVHVCSRLSALQSGSPDPGSLYEFRRARDAAPATASSGDASS